MNESFLSTKETRKRLGVTTQTLVNWSKQGKIKTIKTPSGRRMYSKKDVLSHTSVNQTRSKVQICYARVSSKKQIDDLERQKGFLKSQFPGCELVTDIASGVNWKRKGLNSILERAMQGEIREVVVAHRDRLCRFAFDHFKHLLGLCNVQLTVLDNEESKPSEQELAEDILSIIHIFSCRQMGRRRYSNSGKENTIVSRQETVQDVKAVGWYEQVRLQ